MRRIFGAIGLTALVGLAVALAAGSASAGNRKLVEGTLYDTTCTASCEVECPPIPCGPVTKASRADIVCAQGSRAVACPLEGSLRASAYPVYSGEGAVVKVRRRGSPKVLATLSVLKGHFTIRLGAGEYVLHPYLPEEPCWSGDSVTLKVTAKMRSPIPMSLDVSDSCVAHPDSR